MKNLYLLSTTAIVAAAFMSDVLPTVMVEGDNGPMRINKADYDAAIKDDPNAFTLYEAKKGDNFGTEGITANTVMNAAPGMSAPPAPSTPPELLNDQPAQTLQIVPAVEPSPAGSTIPQTMTVNENQRLVSKIGTGKSAAYFVTNAAGEKIIADGIDDQNGYATEQDAWKAAVPALAGNPAPGPDKTA